MVSWSGGGGYQYSGSPHAPGGEERGRGEGQKGSNIIVLLARRMVGKEIGSRGWAGVGDEDGGSS